MAGALGVRVLLGLAFAGIATASNAMPVDQPHMPTGSETRAPSGYVAFCHRNPDDCAASGNLQDRAPLSFERWQELAAINDEINRRVRPMTDDRLFGRVEFWTYPVGNAGDCEDYALEKRRALIERGWPPRSLRFGVATSPETGRHAVLVVRTDKGDLVLDNLNPYIVSWGSTRYEWISLQSGEDPMVWHAAGHSAGDGSGLATASSRSVRTR